MNPLVTIIIPTFNRAKYISKSIESAISQTYFNIEIIIADDASTDNTAAIIAPFLDETRLQYFCHPKNVGMATNWRVCLFERAKGDWFLILGDDDYLIDPCFIENAINATSNNTEIKMVCAPGLILYERYERFAVQTLPYPCIADGKEIFKKRGSAAKPYEFIFAGVLFHAQTAKALNAFSNPKDIFGDGELFFKIALSHKVGVLSTPVCVYRIHDTSTLTGHLNFDRLQAGFDTCFALWNLMTAHQEFSQSECDVWKKRVLIRYCRGFLVAASLGGESNLTFANAKRFIFAHGKIGNWEVFANASFLARLFFSRFRWAYKIVYAHWRETQILRSTKSIHECHYFVDINA